ncbi:PEP/pyruvate-binding domain-containing protein [Lentisphaerota bacterium WC36G]|nr:hypothetical protein LJT99_04555 [Lentisphaerae bacterium WC36]
MDSAFYYFENSSATVSTIGGKGYNLALLSREKFSVPAWYAVKALSFRDALKNNNLEIEFEQTLASLDSSMNSDQIDKKLNELRGKILSMNLSTNFCDELKNFHQKLIGNEKFFSVRSSAVDEDSGNASFAGMHESFMYVKGIDQLQYAIKKVWLSLISTRALAYRLKGGLNLKNLSIAVVIQEMINAKSSGVIFTANPNSGNVRELIISSLFGAGEGLVSAGLEADDVTVNKFTGENDWNVAVKKFQLVHDKNDAGLVQEALSEEKTHTPSLNESAVKELTSIGKKIEKFYRCPQDIEFCIDYENKVKILQSRPITTLKEDGPAAGNRLIWDNSNIVESYSGPTTPMTFSFIRRAYSSVYNCFSEVMGIPPEIIKENSTVFENMLGLIHGQVYYNIYSWYELIKQFPGFNYNKTFMESMMGVKEKTDTNKNDESVSFFNRYFIELPKLIKLVLRSANNFRKIDKLANQFDDHFMKHYNHWEALDMSKMSPHELMENFQKMETALLSNWKAPIINDFYVMIHYGVLKKICTKWCNDENGTLQNDLICGEGNIESTKPTHLLMSIAQKIKSDKNLSDSFSKNSVQELIDIVNTDPNFEWLKQKVDFYLKEYGFRCINELKLEEPSLREMPDFIFQMIKNYLKMDDESINSEVMKNKEIKIRRRAEKTAFSKMSFLKRSIFKYFVKSSRKGVRNRENMRFARTRIYGKVRETMNSIGNIFEKEGILDNCQHIYYLTVDEVWDFVRGTAVCTNLNGLVKLRKEEFDFYNSNEIDPISDRFETYGMVYHHNLFKNYSVQIEIKEGELQGVGCCPGVIEKEIRVLHSPQDGADLNGEILVAGRTDPGWVPLYPAVSGILIERGSILSHSAIVAREMGIPIIVGIPNLMETLENGQIVKMDGSSGIIITTP